uniref:Endonuclease/exonuclease/phosphatase domain-containing protein n=1 Tax=Scleropages formosus TaxID=113540 RepID=A0A8C9VZX0_SCLFO
MGSVEAEDHTPCDNGNNIESTLCRRKARQSTSVSCQENLMDSEQETRNTAGRWSPRSEGSHHATREEQLVSSSTSSVCDADGSKAQGRPDADVARPKERIRSCKDMVKLGTWNVQSMNLGKLDMVKSEMDKVGVDILGISELKWTGQGHFQSDEHWVCYSGHETPRKNGVAVIVNKRLAKAVLKYTITDKLISIRFQGVPINMTIMQVYAPTSDANEEEIDVFYDQLQNEIEQTSKEDLLIIMGDLNAKVGKGNEGSVFGKYGLGERNEAGNRFVEFCTANNLVSMNTFFQHHKPNKTIRANYDLNDIREEYWRRLNNRFEVLNMDDKVPEELWLDIKTAITEEANRTVLKRVKRKKQPWISEEAKKTAEERRKAKISGDRGEITCLNRLFQREIRRNKEQYFNTICQQIKAEHVHGKASLVS